MFLGNVDELGASTASGLVMRRSLAVTTALIAFVFVVDTIAWAVATARLQNSLVTLRDQMQSDGWRVESGATTRGGWPFAATLAVTAASIEGGEKAVPGGVAWRTDRVELEVSWLHPRTLHIRPEGQELLRVSQAPAIVFSAEMLDALVPLGFGRPRTLDLKAASLIGGLARSGHPQDVRIGSLAVHLELPHASDASNATLAAQLTVSAKQVALPDTRRWPLGATISAFSVEGDLISPRLTGSRPLEQATAWRDGGGTITVRSLDVRWGPLDAQLNLDLGLDSRLQPSGRGHAVLAGYNEALDALAGGGSISPGLSTTAKAVLGLMALKPSESQRPGAIDLPFALKDSTVSVGRIPLARLSDINWH